MNRSGSTAPDVLYEDTFLVNSDISAGYLRADRRLPEQVGGLVAVQPARPRRAGKGQDGKTYGVPMGTDTRGLYYNKQIFAKAGLPDDVAAQDLERHPGRRPHRSSRRCPASSRSTIYSGKSAGEGATMQGLEMLLYGTQDTLYDPSSKKWIVSSKGLHRLVQLPAHHLQREVSDRPAAGAGHAVSGRRSRPQLIPQSKLAIDLDGSWLTGNWKKTGEKPWPQYGKVLGTAMMPTADGPAPGATRACRAAGCCRSVRTPKNPQAAFDFIATVAEQGEHAVLRQRRQPDRRAHRRRRPIRPTSRTTRSRRSSPAW